MISSGLQKINIINNIKKRIHEIFLKKYKNLSLKYNSNIIDNIIYNERAHIVAAFKDRLIIDDNGEFLKRYYFFDESHIRLPKFFEYYELYSKIFPNYTAIPESKYLYQNIQKKQRMIDLQEGYFAIIQKHYNDLIELYVNENGNKYLHRASGGGFSGETAGAGYVCQGICHPRGEGGEDSHRHN